MLPKHELHLKLSKDKKTFTGVLSEWDIHVISRLRRIWIAKIKYLSPGQTDYTEYQSQETYRSNLALDALLKAEGLPTLIGILDSTQTHLAFLDIYAIDVTWGDPPLSPVKSLLLRRTPKKMPPQPQKTPSLAAVKKLPNPKHAPHSRLPVTLPQPIEASPTTSASLLWDVSLPPGPPKGSWYGD